MIVAMTRQRVIGLAGRLPWHLGNDLRRFRALTWGHPLIMGRKTFVSIGRALPGRRNLVLSRDQAFTPKDAERVSSLDQAWALVADAPRCFVIGGAEVYRQAFDQVDRLWITWVETDLEGDVCFPPYDLSAWRVACSERHPASDRDDWPHTFEELVRIERLG